MAVVTRILETALGRVLAGVVVPTTGTAKPTSQPDPSDGIAQAMVVVDGDGNLVTYPDPAPVALPSAAIYTLTASGNGDMTGTPTSPIDVSDYGEIVVNVTSVGGGCTITFNESETSGGAYTSAVGVLTTNTPVAFTSTTSVSQFKIFPNKAWFKLTVSGYTSGTVSATVTCRGFGVLNPVQPITGPRLEGGSASTAPVLNGIEARTSSKTSVSNNQIVIPIGTVDGRTVQLPFAIPENTLSYAASSGGISNTTTAVTAFSAAGSNVRNYVTGIQLSAETLGTATEFAIRDGAAGTVLWRTKLHTTALPVTNITFNPPLRGTANTLVEIVTLTASGSGAVFADLQGYKAP